MRPRSTTGTSPTRLPMSMRGRSWRAGWLAGSLLPACFPDLDLPPRDAPAKAESFDAGMQDAAVRAAVDGGGGSASGRVVEGGEAGVAADGGNSTRARAGRGSASSASGGTSALAGAAALAGHGGSGASGGAGGAEVPADDGVRDAGSTATGGAGGRGGSAGTGGIAGAADTAGSGVAGEAADGGGSGGSQEPEPREICFDWVSIPDITQAVPPAGAWKAGQERVADGQTFDQYICRGDPNGGDMLQIGKGSFGYGCYVPSAGAEKNATSDVEVLVSSAQPACLAWVSPSGQALPSAAVQQGGVHICRAHHSGVTSFGGATSDGEHIGQVRSDANSLGCAFEFYGATLVESSDFEVLVYSSR